MPASSNFTFVYVVTSDGTDAFADMSLVSVLSVRITNPESKIVALCDEPSANALRKSGHALIKQCDELISVATPAGKPTFRNRWIKTQLPKYLTGPCLYLDADTLVRGSLGKLATQVDFFGGVANHNGSGLAEQIWDEDLRELKVMGWPIDFLVYVNGGVFFWQDRPETRNFFEEWHRLWLESVEENGRLRDQPALNTAISRSAMRMTELPCEYNWQVAFERVQTSHALIMHFYPEPTSELQSFGQLVRASREVPLHKLRSYVWSSVRHPEKSIYRDPVSSWLEWRRTLGKQSGPASDLWLMGRKGAALRFWLGGLKKRLT